MLLWRAKPQVRHEGGLCGAGAPIPKRLTQAATALNASGGDLGIELSGYLIEELRDDDNYAGFCADVAEADVFVASLIFIEDLAQKAVDAVAPPRPTWRLWSSRPCLK